MPAAPPSESLNDAFEAALRELAESERRTDVEEVEGLSAARVKRAADLAADGGPVFLRTTVDAASGAYHAIRESIARRGSNVKIVATTSSDAGKASLPVDDLGVMRGLPGLTVVVPADGPTVRSAVVALAAIRGPAYLRLASGSLPVVTEGAFAIGRAGTLRDGADLTVVAIGTPVARALAVATELDRVGVSTRVLDFASFKPHDAKALLRAARDTGAILTIEEHSALTGLGALVAATVAEGAPVPVRRVGLPDLFASPGEPGDRLGLSTERCLEEAWTLLRARGKVQ
jgi:transketolase